MRAVREEEGAPGRAPEGEIVAITDERTPLAEAALELIARMFPPSERQSLVELRSEIAEKRLELLSAYDFHLLTLVGEDGRPAGTVAGVYLEGVNAGFVTYLAVRPELRGRQIARRIRSRLVRVFREDARRAEYEDLAWVIGEVRSESAWLRRLVRHRGAIPFDFTYYHPGMAPGASAVEYVLYRQPIGDRRLELPVQLVRRILYSIYRRAYRVKYPLERPPFQAMLAELEGREMVGPHPAFGE